MIFCNFRKILMISVVLGLQFVPQVFNIFEKLNLPLLFVIKVDTVSTDEIVTTASGTGAPDASTTLPIRSSSAYTGTAITATTINIAKLCRKKVPFPFNTSENQIISVYQK